MVANQTTLGGPNAPQGPGAQPQRALSRPVLTLSTIYPDRRIIAIDATEYDLCDYDDLTIFEHARLARLTRRIEEIEGFAVVDEADTITTEDLAGLKATLHLRHADKAQIVAPSVPRESLELLRIPDLQRIELCFYSALPGENAPETPDPSRPTGAGSWLPWLRATGIGSTGNATRLCVICLLLIAISIAWLLLTH